MPKHGPQGPIDPSQPLPPELDPRGRRHARSQERARAAAESPARAAAHAHIPVRAAESARSRHAASGSSGRDGRRVLTVTTRALAAFVSFAVLLGSGYAWNTFHSFVSNVTHVDAIAPGSTAAKSGTGTAQNILLVGDDHRPPGASAAELAQLSTGQDGGGVNTDTMMVLHVPADGSKATIISFPRDSWVDIPGSGMNKLNSAFTFGSENGGGDAGGARLLIQTIKNLSGLSIDHFVRVSMLGFYDIAQALGPIQVCLNQPAHDSYSGTDLPAGVSELDAKQALSFVRQRHNLPRGDLDREVRQQYFLSAAFRKVASAGTLLNPFKLQNLLHAVSSSLETDPGLDLLKFAEQFQNLSAGNVTFATIPVEGTPTIYVGGNAVSIVKVDPAAVQAFAQSVVGPPSAYATAQIVAPAQVTVTVLNGSGTNGAATQNSTTLQQLGFHVGTPNATTPSDYTVIQYPAGMEAQAKTLAGYVPGARVAQSATVTGVTLVLGGDSDHVVNPELAGTTAGQSTPAPAPAPGSSPSPTRAFSATDCIN
jgi:LCP family protein required for cell wall assembly